MNDKITEICLSKELHPDYTWQDIANIVFNETGKHMTADACRKRRDTAIKKIDAEINQETINATLDDIKAATLEYKKERVKISDERIQNNAYIRQLAREETLKEIATNAATIIGASKELIPRYEIIDKVLRPNEGVLCLSDWHYGIETESYWNKFNPEIAQKRIGKLVNQVIKYGIANNIDTIHVLDLGDLIAGRIHLSIRLESRFDVITQTIEVSEILSEFLTTLSQHFNIKYYSCLDNHSRLEPNKKDAMDLESLARIIPWYLRERLKDNVRFEYIENTFGKDIITFDSLGHKMLGVHGDKDKPIDVVDDLSMMTHTHYDLVLTAHRHHFSADEKNTTIVLGNGTLMGTDTYSKNLRLSCNPSQNFIVVSEYNPIEAIYRIKLN